jgi:hypothetical protein
VVFVRVGVPRHHQSFARDWGTIFFSPKKEIEVTILGTSLNKLKLAPFVFLVLDFVTRREGREGREEGGREWKERGKEGKEGKEMEGKGKGKGKGRGYENV